jgi:hypothetical protein
MRESRNQKVEMGTGDRPLGDETVPSAKLEKALPAEWRE